MSAPAASTNPLIQGSTWLSDPAHWSGPGSIPQRIIEHLAYSGLTVLIAVLIAVPIGLFVGHTGIGRGAVVAVAGMLRALPTLGVLTLFVLLAGLGLMPPIWALVILAVPPLLSGTYAGIAAVDDDVVDAARSMGMTEAQVLFRVEVPNGLAVIMGGFRASVLQVIATVAIVAIIDLGGLGRYLLDGLRISDYGQVLGGAVLITVLAIVVDGLLALVQRALISPGLRIARAPGKEPTADRESLMASA